MCNLSAETLSLLLASLKKLLLNLTTLSVLSLEFHARFLGWYREAWISIVI